MDAAHPLAGTDASRSSSLQVPVPGRGARSASWSGHQRRSLVEDLAQGGKRCTVAAEDFEPLDEPEPDARRLSFAEGVSQSFENLQRQTLLDEGYVQELQQEEPSRLLWLRSSYGLIIQVSLFLVYVSLDCGKTIFNSLALKGALSIVPQSIPVCQAALQVVLGVATALSFLGREALPDVFNTTQILKFLPISLIFATAQAFNVLAYTVVSGGTIKILGQVRLLQTALLSKLLLGRSYQMTQWTTIAVIVMAAAIFCEAKMEDRTHWDCYTSLKKEQLAGGNFTIPEACIMGGSDSASSDASDMVKGMTYVFIYLILGDVGSIVCERYLKDEDDAPYYIQKTWQEIGSFPCAIVMSFVIPSFLSLLGEDEKYWKPHMWWTQDERCSDQSWALEGTNLNYCGGFFRNWTWAACVALLLSMSHSWLSGLVVKKLNSVVKLMGKCASLALVFFVGDCWLLRKRDPPVLCMTSAVLVMVGTFTFMNLKPEKSAKAEESAAPAASSSPSSEAADTEMARRS